MQTELTEKEIKAEICRLAPFYHKVELPYGLSTSVPGMSRRNFENTRVSNLLRHAFPALLDVCGGSLKGKRVLDVACNCGGFSVEAAKLGAEYVLGFDVVDHYIDQANFIKRALRLEQVEFKLKNIENLGVSTVGQFDITFCFGILYHLENPILAMKRLSSVTQHAMLVDTTVARTWFERAPFSDSRKPLWLMNMPPVSSPESKFATTSLWRSADRLVQFRPNETAVVELLEYLGFQKVLRLKARTKGLEKRYYKGARVTFLALRA
jgi:2-polyprenyl-3-methyl-5-hydroxy-6-metoxy-1,4-benzoquinol methylase